MDIKTQNLTVIISKLLSCRNLYFNSIILQLEISKMKSFAAIVSSIKPLTIVAKVYVLDVSRGLNDAHENGHAT